MPLFLNVGKSSSELEENNVFHIMSTLNLKKEKESLEFLFLNTRSHYLRSSRTENIKEVLEKKFENASTLKNILTAPCYLLYLM